MNDRDATADWLLSTQGRIARIVAGSLLIIIGLGLIGGFLGVLLMLIGAVPIASAAYGTLLVGPLFGRDIRGRRPSEQEEEDGGEDEDRSAEDDRSADERPLRRGRALRGRGMERAAGGSGRAARGPGPAHEGPSRGRAGRLRRRRAETSGRRRRAAAGPQPHPPKRDRSACTFATYCFVSSNSPRERTEPRPW